MKLFYDDEFDAITQAISDSGKPFKDVAIFMFPDMKPESAYARLKACTSQTGDQRLTFGQVVRLMAFLECYDPLMYACDETLHARPDRKTADDEKVKLGEVIKGAASTLDRALQRLERMEAREQMRAVA